MDDKLEDRRDHHDSLRGSQPKKNKKRPKGGKFAMMKEDINRLVSSFNEESFGYYYFVISGSGRCLTSSSKNHPDDPKKE